MTSAQIWLAAAVSAAFLLLAATSALSAARAWSVSAAGRWVLGVVLVAVVLACWAWTAVPRDADGAYGRATCIEEPLVGVSSSSDLSTPACLQVNRQAVALGLGAAALVTGAGVLTLRTAQVRGARRLGT